MLHVDPNTLYAVGELEASLQGIVSMDTFLKNLGLKANRMFKGAVWGWEILNAARSVEPAPVSNARILATPSQRRQISRRDERSNADEPAGRLSSG